MQDYTYDATTDAPSIDQIETANRLLTRDMHPLVSGMPVIGSAATFSRETHTYTLRVDVLVDGDEIYAAHRSYCFRIAGDGAVIASSTPDLPAL